jgi:hypothetical protein
MSGSQNPQVLAAAISVLPATAAYTFLPQLNVSHIASMIVILAGLWTVSYVGTSVILHAIKK